MADNDQEVPWEGKRLTASYEFGIRCRELKESDPYRSWEKWEPVLNQIMSDLVTEFWDQGFSQTEIDVAFKIALERLRKYTGGTERRF